MTIRKAAVLILWIAFCAPVTADEVRTFTPLMKAALQGDLKDLQSRIEKGEDVNAIDLDGHSALMWAMKGTMAQSISDEEITKAVQLLVKAGAKVNIKDKQGNTPLILASEKDFKDVIPVLLQSGA